MVLVGGPWSKKFSPSNSIITHIGPFQCSSVSTFVRGKPGLSHIGPYFADDAVFGGHHKI